MESIDELTAPWMGQGCELARRMLALADELHRDIHASNLIREVVRCDYNPIRDQLPPLGPPPTRPATEPGS